MSREAKRVLWEAMLVVALGAGLGLLANFASPRGLALSRNYFPSAAKALPGSRTNGLESVSASQEQGQSGAALTATKESGEAHARLRKQGLQPIEAQEVIKLFRDPQYEQELIVFVDARSEQHYQQGHVPGAYVFDRYYPEKHLPVVLPACLNAATVVVYCTGGECEDSEFAALTLREAGVLSENIRVYLGGFNEWVAQGLPVERGTRRSGELKGGRE